MHSYRELHFFGVFEAIKFDHKYLISSRRDSPNIYRHCF
jgi:hypothetical protein